MKKSYFFLSCAMAVTASVSLQAQDMSILPPGAQLYSYAFEDGAAAKTKAAPMSFTGVGDDKGVSFFGSTYYDYTSRTWFVRSNLNKLSEIDRIARVQADDDYGVVRVMSGEMVNGEYYAHIIRTFTFTQRYGGWAKVNPTTGEWTYLWDAKAHNDNYDMPYNYGDQSSNRYGYNIYQIIDLAYNPADGKLYGLAMGDDATSFDTVIGTVNLEDGMLTPIARTNGYAFGITFSNDGTLYGALRIGTEYESPILETESCEIVKFDYKNISDGYVPEETVTTLEDNDGVFRAYGVGTLTTDYATGTMYLFLNGLQSDNTSRTQSSVFSIDPRNKTNTYLGRFGYSDMLVGATVPGSYKASDLKAPGVVTGLKAAFDAAGADDITLAWGLPEANWDLTDLTDLTAMKVAVDNVDNVVATLPADLSTATYSYTVEGVGQGVHTFYVWAVNNAGTGVPSEVEAWAGHDVPGMPVLGEGHIKANDDNSITFSWGAPVEGKNGGWFDSNVKYNITRLPDNQVVAENLDALTFTDNTITETRAYSYVITPVTADGEGVPAETDAVILGTGVAVPFEADLTVADEARRFKTFDGPSGYVFDAVNARGLYREVERYPVDDYFVTPALMTTQGKVYRVEFDVYFHNKLDELHANTKHDYEIVVGTGDTKEALDQVIFRVDDAITTTYYTTVTIQGWFTAEEDTPYYAAFHLCTDNADSDIIAVSGCRIYEMHDIDLAAVEIIGSKGLAVNTLSPYQVKVCNTGNKDVTDATVTVVSTYKGIETALGSAKIPFIASHETKVVEVMITPEDEGTLELAGRVYVEGDTNLDNDLSPAMTVEIGEMAYDIRVDGGSDSTTDVLNAPFGFNQTYYGAQSLYLVGEGKDLDLKPIVDENKEERLPKLLGIAYEYVTNEGYETGSVEDIHVEVYVSTTTLKNFRSTKRAIVVDDQTKVFDGELSMQDGNNNLLQIPFDPPFELEGDKNLAITVIKTGGRALTEYPYTFNVFNSNWSADDSRTVLYRSNTAPYPTSDTPTSTSNGNDYCAAIPPVPVMYVALEKTTLGVDPVYVSTDGKVALGNLENADVTIFDITGKTVFKGSVSGSVYDLPLADGLYIVSVADASGVRNVKISIRH